MRSIEFVERNTTMILSSRIAHPLTRSYVLKLRLVSKQAGQIVGRLSHVVTGRQFHFGSAEELIAHLVEFDGSDTHREDGA
jgi:hypothetical protein